MLGPIIIIVCLLLLGSINDFAGDWVDLKTGKKYTVIPASVSSGDYITHCSSYGHECSHSIKYNWLYGDLSTPIGKTAKHNRFDRKIQWKHRTWHKLMDSTGLGMFNFLHQLYSFPRIFGLWYGTVDKNDMIIEFKMNPKSHLYDITVTKFDGSPKQHMIGDPQSEQKIKVTAPHKEPLIVYWNRGYKLSCKMHNQFVTFTKIY